MFTPGSSIKLSAAPLLVSDAVKDGLSSAPVTAIKFYASTSLTSNVLVGEATSAPWTATWNHVPAGDYSVTAVTYNKQGSTTSDPVAIQVVKPSVLTAQSSLMVTKGHSASFAVKLSTAPSSPVTVHLSDAGTGTTVSKGQALTFTPSNWNQPQAVTVAAAQAKAGSHSTITASAAGLGSASVAVTAAPAATGYDQWFLNLYNQMTNSANGYFSPKGIPYHSVETAHRGGPGLRSRDHLGDLQLLAVADGRLRPGQRRLDRVQQRLVRHDAIRRPERGQPARVQRLQRVLPGDVRAGSGVPGQLPGGTQLLGPGRL